MCVPEPNDPQDAVVAHQFKENMPLFNKTAKEWTDKYCVLPKIDFSIQNFSIQSSPIFQQKLHCS